ncbi:MarR family transcriptional regulator [Saccharothrix sp. AJ9571]|nr:MarR family transcriptional regulator [Saccharothrix sp. AJ9571]
MVGVHDDLIGDVMLQLLRVVGLHRPLVAPSGESVSASDAMALSELAQHDRLSQAELAERLKLEKSTVSRLAAGLERRGLLVRQRNSANRRYQAVELTSRGRALVDELTAMMQERHRRILRLLSSEEQCALRTGVSGLVRALRTLESGHA